MPCMTFFAELHTRVVVYKYIYLILRIIARGKSDIYALQEDVSSFPRTTSVPLTSLSSQISNNAKAFKL